MEAGAEVRTVRLWDGDPVPALDDLGGAALLMGGVMSAHADAENPWLPGVRALLRGAVDADLPVLGVCLGAQVAAETLGGRTAVPSPSSPRARGSTAQARVHAWRCGSLLALQHHPEADPDRVAFWTARGAARRLGILEETSIAYGTPTADLSEPLRIAVSAARSRAEAVEPVTTVFGRTLADSLVAAARIV